MSTSPLSSSHAAPTPLEPRSVRGWLREPLLHFLLLGGLLFGIYLAFNPLVGSRTDHRIVITEDDLRQMTIAWRAQGRPMPTPEQMASLLQIRIREEVLYREALAMGLDKDDAIVKRRLAQKMEFLAEDISALGDPDASELNKWFEQNRTAFVLPSRVSFRHIYFSPDRRGARTRTDAEEALRRLGDKGVDDRAVASLGDSFMFQERYVDRTRDQLASQFGSAFGRTLEQQKTGRWSGPIESGYGWHLVYVEDLTPGRLPAFDEVADEVKQAWITEQREQAKRKAYDDMAKRYEVILPAAPGDEAAARANGGSAK